MSRPAGDRSGPPRLRYDLLHKLKVLAFANIIPLGIVAFVSFQIWTGKMGIRQDVPTDKVGFWVALLLVCCLVIGVSAWFVMPTVRWLRDYPVWQYQHGSATLWLLPMLAGWAIWLASWMVMTLCAIGMVALLAIGVWSLIGVAQEVTDQPPAATRAVDPPGPSEVAR